MEMLKGQKLGMLPFKGLKKISDLIFYDGPILSHFQDEFGSDILFYWVDYDNNYNRWLVVQITKDQLNEYLILKKSLRDLINAPFNNSLYFIEISDILKFDNAFLVYKGDLPKSYLPEIDSFFAFKIPDVYNSQIELYRDSMLLEGLLEKGLYLKAEPKSKVNTDLVAAIDGGQLLLNVGISFREFVRAAVKKEFVKRDFSGKKATTILNNFIEKFNPNIIKASISSFAIGLSANTLINTDDSFLDREWMESTNAEFKRDVIDIDITDDKNLSSIISKYSDADREDIYKPIIDLYQNPRITLGITDKSFNVIREIKSFPDEKKVKILFKKIIVPEKEIETERLAMVKFNEKTKKAHVVSDGVFGQNIIPGWGKSEILATTKTYNLKYKLLAEYIRMEGKHILENEQLGIYASGDDLTEAERNFYDEFDFIYTRYNSLADDKLTKDVLEIKNYLNSIVAK